MALRDRLPSYQLEPFQLVGSVVFAALVAIISLLGMAPFLENLWFNLGSYPVAGYSILFLFLALGVMWLSKYLLYAGRKLLHMSIVRFILWDIAEMALIALIYTVLTRILQHSGLVDTPSRDFGLVFAGAFAYTLVALGVPYIIAYQYFAILDRDKVIRLMNMESVVSDEFRQTPDDKIITLFDNEGSLKLSVRQKNIFYIEADDNYIKVWFQDHDSQVKQYMLRCRLKTVEESFAGSELVRCHRKYIINISKVQVLSKEKDGYCIDMDTEGIPKVPVSRTYEAAVLARFNSR